MGYVIGYSRMRRLIALLLMAVGVLALAFPLYAHLRVWSGARFDSVLAGLIVSLGAFLTTVLVAIVAWHYWCYQRDRTVCGIRLMGGPCVLLYFKSPVSRITLATTAIASRRGATASVPPATASAIFPYDGHPAMALTVTRVVHWPDCMISLTFDAARRADAALDRIAGLRMAPRVRRMPLWPQRGASSIQMTSPRHLMILADAMPASQFRSLAISLACLQRGVTFVEHR